LAAGWLQREKACVEV
jgi:hypothetical protein